MTEYKLSAKQAEKVLQRTLQYDRSGGHGHCWVPVDIDNDAWIQTYLDDVFEHVMREGKKGEACIDGHYLRWGDWRWRPNRK